MLRQWEVRVARVAPVSVSSGHSCTPSRPNATQWMAAMAMSGLTAASATDATDAWHSSSGSQGAVSAERRLPSTCAGTWRQSPQTPRELFRTNLLLRTEKIYIWIKCWLKLLKNMSTVTIFITYCNKLVFWANILLLEIFFGLINCIIIFI